MKLDQLNHRVKKLQHSYKRSQWSNLQSCIRPYNKMFICFLIFKRLDLVPSLWHWVWATRWNVTPWERSFNLSPGRAVWSYPFLLKKTRLKPQWPRQLRRSTTAHKWKTLGWSVRQTLKLWHQLSSTINQLSRSLIIMQPWIMS